MHYIHNPWVKRRKTPFKTTSKRVCALKRNVARFKNVPDASSFSQAARKRVLHQHEQWLSLLESQSRDVLHRSCYVNAEGDIPRQTVAWLIEDFCTKQKVEYNTVFNCITASNGDLQDPKLIMKDDVGSAYINLLVLDNPTLWRVYRQIPEHQREVQPSDDRPRLVGRPRKDIHLTQSEPFPPPRTLLEPPHIVEIEEFWACCDKCSKWRRVPAEPEGDQWECSSILISCDQPEDNMDDDEKWSGEVKGEQSSALPSALPSTAPSEAPESQEPEPETAPAPSQAIEPAEADVDDADIKSINLFGDSDAEFEAVE